MRPHRRMRAGFVAVTAAVALSWMASAQEAAQPTPPPATPAAPPPATNAPPTAPAAPGTTPLSSPAATTAATAAAPPAKPTEITFNFKGATWDQVLDFFGRVTGLPIVKETPAPDGVV